MNLTNCPYCNDPLLSLQARCYKVRPYQAVNPSNWKWCENCDEMIDLRIFENFTIEIEGSQILNSLLRPKISKISNGVVS